MKNLKLFFTFFTTLCLTTAFAQYDESKINKKAIEAYYKGIEKAQDGKYKDALESFKEAIKRDANYVDAYLSLAGVYGQLKDHQQSIAFYEKAFPLDTNYTAEFRLPYSINLAGTGQFEKALEVINILLSKPKLNPNTRKAAEYRQKTYQFAVDYAKTNAAKNYVFTPKNLNDGINSNESEYFPSMPIEGNEMIFTRRVNEKNEDFFISKKTENGWSAAQRLPGNINTPENEGAQIISQDGQWLVFTGCDRPDGNGGCDIYLSYQTTQGWSEAINLGVKVNSEFWDSQPCLSPDKRDLYFASNRPGGFGGRDIYVCRLQPNGRWSEPENMGAGINTAGDEVGPFIHADNQTLYFSSTGLPGYGGYDLFMTRKGPNGAWSKPTNLGYPINTINEEATLFIAADGITAYYSSDKTDGKGGIDIYSFEMRPDLRPYKTLWIKGNVYDQKTTKGLPSAVELIDLAKNTVISKVQTNEKGDYLITLPIGKDYAFNVNRKGYLFYSDNFSLKDKSPDSTYTKNIGLQPIEVNAAVILKNIFFDFNKFDIKPESEVELNKVIELLTANPTVKIQIGGHTDNIGKAADNQVLSQNRAKAVINYLVSKGIDASRLSYKGFGATAPIADNNTEEGRAKNRRTELKVIGM